MITPVFFFLLVFLRQLSPLKPPLKEVPLADLHPFKQHRQRACLTVTQPFDLYSAWGQRATVFATLFPHRLSCSVCVVYFQFLTSVVCTTLYSSNIIHRCLGYSNLNELKKIVAKCSHLKFFNWSCQLQKHVWSTFLSQGHHYKNSLIVVLVSGKQSTSFFILRLASPQSLSPCLWFYLFCS